MSSILVPSAASLSLPLAPTDDDDINASGDGPLFQAAANRSEFNRRRGLQQWQHLSVTQGIEHTALGRHLYVCFTNKYFETPSWNPTDLSGSASTFNGGWTGISDSGVLVYEERDAPQQINTTGTVYLFGTGRWAAYISAGWGLGSPTTYAETSGASALSIVDAAVYDPVSQYTIAAGRTAGAAPSNYHLFRNGSYVSSVGIAANTGTVTGMATDRAGTIVAVTGSGELVLGSVAGSWTNYSPGFGGGTNKIAWDAVRKLFVIVSASGGLHTYKPGVGYTTIAWPYIPLPQSFPVAYWDTVESIICSGGLWIVHGAGKPPEYRGSSSFAQVWISEDAGASWFQPLDFVAGAPGYMCMIGGRIFLGESGLLSGRIE